MKVVRLASASTKIRRGQLAPKPVLTNAAAPATQVAQKLFAIAASSSSTSPLQTSRAHTATISPPFLEAQAGDSKDTAVDKPALITTALSTPPSTPRPPEPQPEDPIPDSETMQPVDGQQQPAIAHTAASTLPSTTTESVSEDVAPFLTKHIPERYTATPPQDDSQPGSTNYCYRHRPDVKCRRQADEITMDSLQKKLETLPEPDQQLITQIWNIFSAAPSTHKTIILQGILTQCCLPQLSFVSALLRDLIRIDFLTALPVELSFKILSYLDTTSLCKAAQVSQKWRMLADDDVVWHKMCEQHIDRRCDKCGWGLPLLERKRLRATKRQIQLRASGFNLEMAEATSNASRLNIHGKRIGDYTTSGGYDIPGPPAKRSCQNADSNMIPCFDEIPLPKKRPWKDVYSERYKVESNWRRGRCTTRIFKGHSNGIICLQFDDTILVTGSYDTTIKIWDIETGKEIRTLTGHTLGVRALQFDDSKLISGSMDNTLKIWNYRTGQCLNTLPGHTEGVISLHFDSSLLVSGSVDKTIKVWNFGRGSCITLRGHRDWVNSVKLHSPSRTILSASDDMTVKLWDLDTNTCIRTLDGHVGQVQQALPFELSQHDVLKLMTEVEQEKEKASSGTDAGSSSADPQQTTSPLASPPYTQSILSPSHYSAGLSSSASSAITNRESIPRYILTAALDSTVKLWDVETGRCIRTLFGHVAGIWALAADTLRVVSGAQDKMVKVWNMSTGKCERTITGHAAAVTCLALSDSRLITGSEDCEARMYCFKSVVVRNAIPVAQGNGEGSSIMPYAWIGSGTVTPPEHVGVAGEGNPDMDLPSHIEEDGSEDGDDDSL
ncbi:WD40 repeat-like protein [Terfezia boudieri ATCC MYA-4762]|uniref:WD40 repeat-like protein n=1 Tax=Terfezia boudieri ATCC MYA-4762 TaxID=1051890 RepID=A0A3N4LLM7_9PEZI|nr:WD40 repeat-like protein [Terfezia boudieri ATCC MYA-4762]